MGSEGNKGNGYGYGLLIQTDRSKLDSEGRKYEMGYLDIQNNTKWVAKVADMDTLYNVCLVHRETFSTSGGVQYIGKYHEYIGEIS